MFALVSEYAGIYNTSSVMAPWQVDRELDVAREKVRSLRKRGADVVVVLSNVGYTHERRLAREVEGIDVIFGGFDFPGLREPFVDPDHHTLIVRPYTGFSNVGRLDLWVDPEAGGIYRYTYQNLSLLLDDFPPEEPSHRP
jgi:2',3'-cyclic-nucleotide 2'-phosphodiesterase (5'-nucleotidase family)